MTGRSFWPGSPLATGRVGLDAFGRWDLPDTCAAQFSKTVATRAGDSRAADRLPRRAAEHYSDPTEACPGIGAQPIRRSDEPGVAALADLQDAAFELGPGPVERFGAEAFAVEAHGAFGEQAPCLPATDPEGIAQ